MHHSLLIAFFLVLAAATAVHCASEAVSACPMPKGAPMPRTLDGWHPSCFVHRATVRLDPRSVTTTMRDEDLLNLLGDPTHLRWDFASRVAFGCVDGRYTEDVLATPGGDIGEFVLAMTAYEEMTGNRLEADDVGQILLDYLTKSPKQRFAMCTDVDAIAAMQTALGITSLNLRNPPESRRSDVLELVADINKDQGAYTTGSHHLRFMMENPAEYAVRPRLIQHIVRAFYALLWQGHPKLRLDILQGNHTEVAEVSISVSRECLKCGLAPLVTPKTNAASMYISHPDAVQVFRDDLAGFVASRCDTVTRASLLHRMNVRAGLQHMSTIGRTSKKIPFYTVTFD